MFLRGGDSEIPTVIAKNGTETDYELKTMIGNKKLSNSE